MRAALRGPASWPIDAYLWRLFASRSNQIFLAVTDVAQKSPHQRRWCKEIDVFVADRTIAGPRLRFRRSTSPLPPAPRSPLLRWAPVAARRGAADRAIAGPRLRFSAQHAPAPPLPRWAPVAARRGADEYAERA